MQIISHCKHAVNITQTERIISAIGGGFLAAAGLQRRGTAGAAMAVIGGDLLRRAITGHSHAYEAIGIRTAPKGQGAETTSVPYELGIRVDRSITIDKPREEVYRFWRNLENLPKFMRHVEHVEQLDRDRSRWTVCAPAGRRVSWDAVIHNESANEMVAWRSLPGCGRRSRRLGLVHGRSAGQGTEVKVELQYNPPAGMIGAAIASLWGEEPGQQIEEDLRGSSSIWKPARSRALQSQSRGTAKRCASRTAKWRWLPRTPSPPATPRLTNRLCHAGISCPALQPSACDRRNNGPRVAFLTVRREPSHASAFDSIDCDHAGSHACLAVQPELGLLSERRAGSGSIDSRDSAFDGADIASALLSNPCARRRFRHNTAQNPVVSAILHRQEFCRANDIGSRSRCVC